MKKYLTIFQFGPVQDFIQTARRTDDYWAGSFLLSYTTAHVIRLLENKDGTIIFPNPEENELVKAVCANLHENRYPSKSLRPSLPNRVAALVEADGKEALKNILKAIKASVLEKIVYIFNMVEKKLTGDQQLSSNQIEDLFEFFYAFDDYDPDNHRLALRCVEENLAARKNMRNFKPFDQHGFKCTQCGFREPFRGESSTKNLKELKHYWEKLRIEDFRYRFKENERLCAVCSGKRLLRRICFDGAGIPSTSTITVSAWVDQIAQTLNLDNKAHYTTASNFSFALQSANLIREMTPVPCNENKPHLLYKIEGDCFIEDTYDRFKKEAEKAEGTATVADVKEARQRLKKMLGTLDESLQNPPKYYTILAFDGDDMGKHLQTLETCEDHQGFSKRLAGFTETVYQTVHEDFHGYVIYYGGDEGIVLIPLSETLEVMNKLREEFQTSIGLTLSVGAAVVHHQAPLGQGLRSAENTLKAAKKIKHKNAFAFNIRKRSGSHLSCASPWEVVTQAGRSTMAEFLESWRQAYEKGLSTRWYHHFSAVSHICQTENGYFDPDMFINEFYRILPRHVSDKKGGTATRLINATREVIFSPESLMKADNLLSLLYLPIYIYQGGKD